MSLPIALGHDGIRDRSAHDLGLWPAKDRFRHRVPIGDDAVGVHRDDRVEGGIEDACQPPQIFALRHACGFSFCGGADFAFDGRPQPGKVLLEYVVACATAHHGDGGILTDRPGDDDKWDVEASLFQYVKRAWGTELGQVVVGDDQVKTRIQLGRKAGLGVHPFPDRGQTRVTQVLRDELGIVGLILDDQDAERFGHVL